VGLKSKSHVMAYLTEMEARGWIERQVYRSRTIKVLDAAPVS